MLVPVILVGGNGTRLAPISTPEFPKPFLDLADTGKSLFQTTLLRAQLLSDIPPIIIGAAEHAELIQQQLDQLNAPANLVLEPYKRNTAPAITVAALYAKEHYGEKATLIVLPADHHIEDDHYFANAIAQAQLKAPDNHITVFGIRPTHANTNYGYICHDANHQFQSFVEKPDQQTAKSYLAASNYLWNSGFFLIPVDHYLMEVKQHEVQIFTAAKQAFEARSHSTQYDLLSKDYVNSPSRSVDHAILEHSPNIHLSIYKSGWSDLGTWSALYDLWPKKDGQGVNSNLNLKLVKHENSIQLFRDEKWIADVK